MTQTTTRTDYSAREMTDAIEAGHKAALAMVPGAVFQGAFQMADAAGYREPSDGARSPLRSLFCHTYVDVIERNYPRGVPTVAGQIIAD